jgi:transcriptional regulator with XRE-family HTH domain
MKQDRERLGLTAAQVAGRLGITRTLYLEIEAGTRWPDSTTWERLVALFGWPE